MNDGLNKIGAGNMSIPSSFDRFDDILKTDPGTTANSVSSLVRLFSEEDPTTPFFEWLPNQLIPTSSKTDPDVSVTGVGIKGILGYARLEPYDWDGSASFTPNQPDWEYGGINTLPNGDLESSPVTPKQFNLSITATGGTYTLTDGTDTTSAIAFNATAATIETRIETDLGMFSDVIVVQIGTSPVTFLIEMVTPAFGVNLGINTGSLTGGTGTTVTVTEGGQSISPWTQAQTLATGIPKQQGSYDTPPFVSPAQNHTPGGSYSLAIDPGAIGISSNRNPGGQYVTSAQQGAIHQVSVWVYPTSATDRFRLGLFTVGEEVIDWDSAAGATLTANTWNELTLTDVLIDVSEVIIRVAVTNVGPYSPSLFYLDDLTFTPGLAPASVGDILTQIYDHATDSGLRTPIVWDDGAGTPYLTLDFDASLDSNGNAWDESELHTKLTMRQSYSLIMANFSREYGYEYRIVPDDVEAGTWLWQVYNPGTMDAAPDVAIQSGTTDVRRSISRFTPSGSNQMVEGLGRITARATDAGLMSALGRIEASVLDREVADLSSAALAAAGAVSSAVTGTNSASYTVTNPPDEPMSKVLIGDTVTIVDPPEIVATEVRLVDVTLSFSSELTEWETQYGSIAITNPDAAVADAVSGLLNKFEYPFPESEIAPFGLGGGTGGAFTVQVAASNATENEKEKADFVCVGSSSNPVDHLVLQQAVDSAPAGRILLSSGTFYLGDSVDLDDDSHVQGMGWLATSVRVPTNGNPGWNYSTVADSMISDMTIFCTNSSTGVGIFCGGGAMRIQNIWFNAIEVCMSFACERVIITGCSVQSAAYFIDADGNNPVYSQALVMNEAIVANNYVGSGNSRVSGSWILWSNNFQQGGVTIDGAVSGTADIVQYSNNTHYNANGENAAQVTIRNFNLVTVSGNGGDMDGFTGYEFDSVTELVVLSNMISLVNEGLVLTDVSTFAIVGNQIGGDPDVYGDLFSHGIHATDSSRGLISSNHIVKPGYYNTTDTKDGVLLDGACDDISILANKFVGDDGAVESQPRWAVNVGGSCTNITILGNDSGPTANWGRNGAATATNYNPNGIATMSYTGGAAGDNI